MLKQFMNSGSLKALMVYDAEKSDIEKAREAIAKNTIVGDPPKKESEEEPKEEELDEEIEGEEEGEKEEPELDDDGNSIEKKEETAKEKAAREAKEADERIKAKEARKTERMQKRIDTAIAAQRNAEAEIVKLKAQLEANPDKKLTEAEVQSRADAIAAEKIAAKDLERLQKEFNETCDKLQSDATKIDKEFTPKVVSMTNDLGPIPSRLIGILSELDNGAEVLAFMANDIDEAEKLYDLKERPEKLAIAIVRISDKLADAKKPKKPALSRVPNQGEPVKPRGNVNSDTITGKESTEEYIRKRRLQQEQLRKNRGY